VSKILAVANQKGGVGKTTTAVNLAASLAATHKRVLLVDLDPQGNATMGSGIDKSTLDTSIYEVLTGKEEIEQVIVKTPESGFELLPANGDLTAAEVELLGLNMKELRLKYALTKVKNRFDYILIDCPPSLNMLTVNALVASDGVLIPVQCEYYALEGISALVNTVNKIKSALNKDLKIEGVIRTMYDPRNTLTNQVSSQLLKHFPNQVYNTTIPRNVRLAEAPSHGLPALIYDRQSRGAVSYMALAAEMNRKSRVAAQKAVPA